MILHSAHSVAEPTREQVVNYLHKIGWSWDSMTGVDDHFKNKAFPRPITVYSSSRINQANSRMMEIEQIAEMEIRPRYGRLQRHYGFRAETPIP